jgi:hypothetical protein
MSTPRASRSLADLEHQLAKVDLERNRIIAEIQSTVERLRVQVSAGRPFPSQGAAAAPPRHFSAAARKRLSELAKLRWAKAKKAGQTRLG